MPRGGGMRRKGESAQMTTAGTSGDEDRRKESGVRRRPRRFTLRWWATRYDLPRSTLSRAVERGRLSGAPVGPPPEGELLSGAAGELQGLVRGRGRRERPALAPGAARPASAEAPSAGTPPRPLGRPAG